MTEIRSWEQVRADAVQALTAAADFSGDGDGMVLGSAVVLADAVLAVCDEEAVSRMAEVFVEETRIRSMDFRNGATMDLEPSRTLVASWVGAARAMLGDAPNYSETEIDFGLADPPGVEMTIGVGGGERYVFRVQRRGKLTPHQARQQAEARADAAEAKLAAVRESVSRIASEGSSYDRELLAILDGTEGET